MMQENECTMELFTVLSEMAIDQIRSTQEQWMKEDIGYRENDIIREHLESIIEQVISLRGLPKTYFPQNPSQ